MVNRASRSEQLSVAFVISSLDRGGGERQLLETALALRDRGHRCSVFALRPGSFTGAVREAGIDVWIASRGRLDIALVPLRLIKALRHMRPHVTFGWLLAGNIIAFFLRRLTTSKASLLSIRGVDPEPPTGRRLRTIVYPVAERVEAWVARRPRSFTLCNSRAAALRALTRGLPGSAIRVIHNGIDIDAFRFDGGARDAYRTQWGIGTDFVVGRIAGYRPIKGHAMLLEAVALARQALPTLRLVCVGANPAGYRSELEMRARELGIGDHVLFSDATSDVAGVLSAFDIHVSSSRSESFPNVVCEAMACGVPCIVTDVGESAEIVGNLGVVVPPESPTAMADALLELGTMSATARSELSVELRGRIIDRFSRDALGAAVDDLLRHAIDVG